jgi:hypothetical protein
MVFVKSILAGTLALFAYVFLSILALRFYTPPDTGVGVIAGPGWPFLIGAVLVFGTAFYWMFKKSSRRDR